MTKEQVKAYLDAYIIANKKGGITAAVLNSGLTAMLNEGEDALNAALENYYTTGQTYTKDEVDSLIGASMKFIVADELPNVEDADRKAIYLIPSSVSAGTDYYDEYVVVVTGEAPDEQLAWEHIGTTQTELDQYAKIVDVESSADTLNTKIENVSASTIALSAATVGIEENLAALSGSVIDNYATKEEVIANELTVSAAINSLDARITASTADIAALSASTAGIETNVGNLSAATVGIEGTLTAHTNDDVIHITAEERALWNSLTALTSEIVSITYADLKDLRDASGLTSGKMYRINDYTTTTAQANTQAAGHDFDVVVLATDVDKLNEYAKVIARSGDTYFTGSTLEAWEIKYCLDNDTNRFAWADTTNGKGVIYYMKDEFDNECAYDFKNIQFQRWAVTNVVNSKISADALSALQDQFIYSNSSIMYGYKNSNITAGDTTLTVDANQSEFYYTFAYVDENGDIQDATIACQNLTNEERQYDGVWGNKIGQTHEEVLYPDSPTSMRFILGNNALVSVYSEDGFYGSYANKFGNNVYYNTIGNNFYRNTIGNNFYRNTIGNEIYSNTIGNEIYYNTIGNSFQWNTIGNSFQGNTIGNNFYRNTIGNNVNDNTIGNNVSNNTIGNSFQGNTIGNEIYYNTIGNNFYRNTIGNSFQWNTIGNEIYSNTIGNEIYYNTIGNNFYRNTIGNYFQGNTIGNGVQYITASATTGSIQYLTVLDGTKGTSSSNILNIMTSGAGTEVDPTVNVVVGASYPQFIGFDSDGALRIKNIMNMSSFS